ncbi:MAG: HAMP domain-containing histidine kinase [Myxococcota bacterium]|nr:HAMP domain-containing histidine kinase [Myxococcota bacterium]
MSAGLEAGRERLAVIGEIAAEIAHELRNLLLVIGASAYVARLEAGKGEAARALPHVATIEKNARLAHDLVDDLMGLARGEPLAAEPIDIGKAILTARADIMDGAARWEDGLIAADVRVRAHPRLLARMLHALYENAIHAAAPRAPCVSTRAWVQGDRVLVEIADDGPGVSAEVAARIFEPLFTARPGGTGLGLALARRIAQAHGGAIALVAGAAQGATFRIELPR